MAQRNKGLTQEAAAVTAGISVRSGRRIEKGQWKQSGDRHWRTRQDPLEDVWLSDILPLLQSRPQVSPTTVLEYLQDKYPGKYPDNVRRTLQRRIRTWKANTAGRHPPPLLTTTSSTVNTPSLHPASASAERHHL